MLFCVLLFFIQNVNVVCNRLSIVRPFSNIISGLDKTNCSKWLKIRFQRIKKLKLSSSPTPPPPQEIFIRCAYKIIKKNLYDLSPTSSYDISRTKIINKYAVHINFTITYVLMRSFIIKYLNKIFFNQYFVGKHDSSR